MTAQTGRTVGKYLKVQIDDSGGTLRDIPVTSVGGLGINYDEVDLAALQDLVKGVLSGQGNITITLTGPVSNAAAVTASATTEPSGEHLSGSHTVLSAVNGGNTPLAFGVYLGIRHDWEAGEPVFGITGTATNGFLVTSYVPDGMGMYTATVRLAAGSAAPAWGTSAIS